MPSATWTSVEAALPAAAEEELPSALWQNGSQKGVNRLLTKGREAAKAEPESAPGKSMKEKKQTHTNIFTKTKRPKLRTAVVQRRILGAPGDGKAREGAVRGAVCPQQA